MSRYNEDGNYTRLGRIHHNMKTRCTNPNYDKYKYYGGKGISVCDEWMKSYDAFEEWALSYGYEETLTLDRINTDDNYSPENCRWVSRKEQANNRSSNHFLTYNGITKTIQQWSEEIGLAPGCITQRIKAGWDTDRVLTESYHETHKPRYLTYNGVTKRMHEWAKEFGLSYKVLQNRIDLRHWPIEKALFTPVDQGWSYGN